MEEGFAKHFSTFRLFRPVSAELKNLKNKYRKKYEYRAVVVVVAQFFVITSKYIFQIDSKFQPIHHMLESRHANLLTTEAKKVLKLLSLIVRRRNNSFTVS